MSTADGIVPSKKNMSFPTANHEVFPTWQIVYRVCKWTRGKANVGASGVFLVPNILSCSVSGQSNTASKKKKTCYIKSW